jgi:hypothetical protein
MQVTYLDPNDDAPKIEWQGVTFRALVPIDLDETRYAPLIEAARTHPHFRVEGANGAVPRETTEGPLPSSAELTHQPATYPVHLERRDPTPADVKWVLDYLRRCGIEPETAVAASGTAEAGTIAPGGSVSHSSPPGDKPSTRGRTGRFMKAADLPSEPLPEAEAEAPPQPGDRPWST